MVWPSTPTHPPISPAHNLGRFRFSVPVLSTSIESFLQDASLSFQLNMCSSLWLRNKDNAMSNRRTKELLIAQKFYSLSSNNFLGSAQWWKEYIGCFRKANNLYQTAAQSIRMSLLVPGWDDHFEDERKFRVLYSRQSQHSRCGSNHYPNL